MHRRQRHKHDRQTRFAQESGVIGYDHEIFGGLGCADEIQGNSFVHETESQVILNGSRDINFTMDLVQKDIGLFQSVAERHGVPLEISPLMIEIFRDGAARFGARAQSDDIIRRLEEATGLDITAPGFPAEMVDDEPEEPGYEVRPLGRA